MANNDVTIVIKADGTAAIKGFNDVGNSAENAGKKAGGLGKTLADVGKIAGGIVIAKGFEAGASAIKNAFSAAVDFQKMQAATAAVIESTGGKAGVTAKAVTDLSNSLEKVTAIDDQVIQGAQNLLLTFTNIGKDVFPSATEAVLNMSTAMGTDANGAAIQLGKALNDPVKGITALTRVGVTFTDEQKKTIEAMVEMGDVAGAQKVILKELEVEFGGAARAAGKTLGGQLSLLQDTISDTFRDIAVSLLPAVIKLAEWLSGGLTRGLDAAGGAFRKARDFVGDFIGDVKWLVENGGSLMDIVAGDNEPTFWQKLAYFVAQVYPPLRDIAKMAFDGLLKVGGIAWDALKDGADALAKMAAAAWDKIDGPLSNLADIAWQAVKDGAEALAKLAGLAWDKMKDAFNALKDLALSSWVPLLERAAGAIKTIAEQKLDQTAKGLKDVGDQSKDGSIGIDDLAAAFDNLKKKLGPAYDTMKILANDILERMKDTAPIVADGLHGIADALRDLWDALKPLQPVLEALGKLLGVILVAAIVGFMVAVDGMIQTFNGTLKTALDLIEGAVKGLAAEIRTLTEDAGEVKDAVVNAFTFIKDNVSGPISTVAGWIQGLIDKLGTLQSLGNKVLPGNPFGGGGSGDSTLNGVGGGSPPSSFGSGPGQDTTGGRDIFNLNSRPPDLLSDWTPPGNTYVGGGQFATIPIDPVTGERSAFGTWMGDYWSQNGQARSTANAVQREAQWQAGKAAVININNLYARDEAEARAAAGNLAYSLALAGV